MGHKSLTCDSYKVLNGALIKRSKEQKESERIMAIKIAHKIKRTPIEETPPKVEKTKKEARPLPSDDYKDEIDPKEIVLDESGKLIVSVKRGGEYGLPGVDIRHYVTTERYTGFTKKGVNFPLEFLLELVDLLREVSDECESKGLE